MAAAIGMMDEGYFVGRKEIVEWINGTLRLSLSKVEQTASGAVACQLLDRMYPGAVPLHKVNWNAKADYEFIGNYKILQSCFTKLKIDKAIDVEKLVRAKYQDNLEFMQWFKRFYEMKDPSGDYDPVAKRAMSTRGGTPGGIMAGQARAAATRGSSVQPLQQSSGKRSGGNRSMEDKENSMQHGSSASARRSSVRSGGSDSRKREPIQAESKTGTTHKQQQQQQQQQSSNSTANEALVRKVEALTEDNTQLQTTVENLEKERDFYFEKLTLIEELLQEKQAQDEKEGESPSVDVVAHIFKILYATENGAVGAPPDEADPVEGTA